MPERLCDLCRVRPIVKQVKSCGYLMDTCQMCGDWLDEEEKARFQRNVDRAIAFATSQVDPERD